jgi:2-polyprenyl-3-methyl-5-hydroxy-6-metoxy-1,4-benzoquinol methylase
MKNYLNWKEYKGSKHHQRANAVTNAFEKNIIEARYNWAISRLRKHRVTTVLDVGCGLGYGTYLISKAGFKVDGIDKSRIAIEVCWKRYPDINSIIGEFPENVNHKYDAIVVNEIIEHVADYEVFITGCFELLNGNGLLLLTTPNRKYTKNRNPHHIHEFTVEELKELFPRSKIRAFSTRLFKGQKLLSFIVSGERVQKFGFLLSRLPIVSRLPQYGMYFLVEAEKKS